MKKAEAGVPGAVDPERGLGIQYNLAQPENMRSPLFYFFWEKALEVISLKALFQNRLLFRSRPEISVTILRRIFVHFQGA